MVRYVSVALVAIWACGIGLSARQVSQAPRSAATVEVSEGRRLFQQKCSLCHLAPVKGDTPYGPRLSKAQVNSAEDGVREIIRGGIGRMPGFQYALEPRQIAAIIAFMKTLDAPPDRVIIDAPNP